MSVRKIVKGIYQMVPFKKQLFTGVKAFYTPSKNVYQHLHFKDVIEVKVNATASFKINHYGYVVENEMFWGGYENGWEKHSMNIWRALCEDANVILDIGANTGVYALAAQAIRPDAAVHAFEPVERVYQKLKQNVDLNQYPIKLNKFAVSNGTGEAVIYDSDDEHTSSVAVNKNISDTPEATFEVKIQIDTLDRYIKKENITGIDLMKIDVEEHEVEALEGFKEHLQRFAPSMLIEILNDEVAAGISKLIEGMDYVYFNIDENSGIREVKQLAKSDYYNYLLCNETVAKKIRKLYE